MILWVGIPFASLVFGDVFRLLSPWRALGRAVGSLVARVAPAEPLEYPARLGRRPAAAGILFFGVVELCWAAGREPQTLAILALLYLVVAFVGMSLYGVEPWTRNADPFGVYFSLFASLSPFTRRDGVLLVRPPVTGAVHLPAVRGRSRCSCSRSGSPRSTAAAKGTVFNSIAPISRTSSATLGFGLGRALELTFLVGLGATVLLVAAIYWGAIAGMPRRGLRRPTSRGELGLALVHTLVPIAAAYVVAHYFSLLAYNGQDIWRLASDPLGDGSDLFGAARPPDRLLDRLGDGDLVRPGRHAGARPRGRAGAGPRPRAGALRRSARRPPARRSSCWC